MTKYKVFATRNNEHYEYEYNEYWQALTTALYFKNHLFTVEIKNI